ncbi:hypothetical protein RQP53_20935 [Paucibacter sp. APW11]|uniref:Uncharacterized protein n=1 Tax=Roseateles aquae TaxID=3077235 RepID=A0ABU3PGQ1_9BURK|nr:hypothetical protein [Paucibacter sp. APW11]MDT9001755.1 hypothetical protein [Paucibacter sp. APW11]
MKAGTAEPSISTELDIKRAELSLKEREFARSRWTNPLIVGILAALAAAITSSVLQYLSAAQATALEQARWERTHADDERKWLLDRVLEFSAAVNIVLGQMTQSNYRMAQLVDPKLRNPVGERGELVYWRTKAFLDSVDAMQQIELAVHARDSVVAQRLSDVVEEVRVFSRSITDDMHQIGAGTEFRNQVVKPKLSRGELIQARRIWLEHILDCRRSIGAKIFTILGKDQANVPKPEGCASVSVFTSARSKAKADIALKAKLLTSYKKMEEHLARKRGAKKLYLEITEMRREIEAEIALEKSTIK